MGDIILGTRLVQAIKDKHPNSEIIAFIDSEGATFQRDVIKYIYPSFYKEIKIIPNKKYKKCIIESQFGPEEYRGALENIPDDIYKEMTQNYDIFEDLHIDSLNWAFDKKYDYFKYFNSFPKPEIAPTNEHGDFVVLNLISESNQEHQLEQWFLDTLITRIHKQLYEKYKIFIISTPKINSKYDKIKDLPNLFIFNGDITKVVDLIANCKGFLSTDTGFKFVSYAFEKPTLSFSRYCPAPHKMQISHSLRWNPWEKLILPMNFDAAYVTKLFCKILDNKLFLTYPELANYSDEEINQIIIKRNYKVSLEKSI